MSQGMINDIVSMLTMHEPESDCHIPPSSTRHDTLMQFKQLLLHTRECQQLHIDNSTDAFARNEFMRNHNKLIKAIYDELKTCNCNCKDEAIALSENKEKQLERFMNELKNEQ